MVSHERRDPAFAHDRRLDVPVLDRQPRTLIVGYARVLHSYLQSHGINPRAVLSAADMAQIEGADSFARFSLERWDAAMARAEELLGDPELPLRLAEQIKPWSLGLLGFMMLTCRVLGEVGTVVAHFENPVNDVSRVWFEDGTTKYVMRLKPNTLGGSRRLMLLAAGSWAWQSRWLTGRHDLVFDASFDIPPPPDLSAYHRSFGGSLSFGSSGCWVEGDRSYLQLPVLQADPGIHHILRLQALEKLKYLVDSNRSLLARLERLVQDGLEQGSISLEELADQIGLSPRTLQNRLHAYGVNFRSLVDGVRRAQAERYLRDESRSLIEIAMQLGFTTQASFQHAFKRWTGSTPGEFRRRGGHEGSEGRSRS